MALAMLVFGRPSLRDAVPGTPPTPIVLLLPVFGWAAMRFGVGGVSAALLGSAFVASYETAMGLRPFATMTPIDSLIAVQMILAVVAMPLMCWPDCSANGDWRPPVSPPAFAIRRAVVQHFRVVPSPS